MTDDMLQDIFRCQNIVKKKIQKTKLQDIIRCQNIVKKIKQIQKHDR